MNKNRKQKGAEAFCITVILIFLLLLVKILYQPETETERHTVRSLGSGWYQIRDGEKITLDVIHSHNLEAAEEFRKEVLTTFPNIGEVNIFPLSLSVSCHIGPGSLALACSKVRPEIW